MAADHIKKNMLIKSKYMTKRFGLFKSIVYRYMQYKYWCQKVSILFFDMEMIGDKLNLQMVIKLFEYLYTTRDIWISNKLFEKFEKLLYKKTRQYYSLFPFLIRFGCLCPYIQENRIVCGEMCLIEGFCNRHFQRINIIKNRLKENLLTLPTDIHNIIIVYALPIKRY